MIDTGGAGDNRKNDVARILIHDYSGHAFTVGLARWLAEQGIETHYWYSQGVESPRGNLQRQPGDAPGFHIRGVGHQSLNKYSLVQRIRQEAQYGRLIAIEAVALAPDVVLSNAPPQIQAKLRKAVSHQGGAFIFWMQDIYSLALRHLLRRKWPFADRFLGPLSHRFENNELRRSDAVVCISEEFRNYCLTHGMSMERCVVIENWAALKEIPALPKENAWAVAHGLDRKFVFLFSGTLGLKHNPELFVALAQSLRDVPDAACVVVSQGAGRQKLEMRKAELGLTNLHLFDYQHYADFPQVLATGDVLMAILEPFASELSVPSKVLAYFCAARPLLTAIPESNHSARLVRRSGAGIVLAPGDDAGFLRAARTLMEDHDARLLHSAAARRYAEETFDIDRIGARYLALFQSSRRSP